MVTQIGKLVVPCKLITDKVSVLSVHPDKRLLKTTSFTQTSYSFTLSLGLRVWGVRI